MQRSEMTPNIHSNLFQSNLVKTKSQFTPEEIDAQVEAFLASGGKIEQLPNSLDDNHKTLNPAARSKGNGASQYLS